MVNRDDIETAIYFWSQLREAVEQRPVRKAYSLMGQLFQQLLHRATAHVNVRLVGTFAKTDYLLKEHGADPSLRQAVNGARARLRSGGTREDESALMHDFAALCRFVALIYHCEVPDEIADLFPAKQAKAPQPRPEEEYFRMVVDRWDDRRLYGRRDDEQGSAVTVRYAGTDLNAYHFDWSSLRELLFEGTQLNVVNPVRAGDELLPELLIFEPDYLVDITTVAACFETYAHSPLVAMLNRVKPQPCSSAILLGNLTGQLLDDELHHHGSPTPYAKIARQFFDHSVLNLLTTEMDPDFHAAARRQRDNIHQAVSVSLPQALRRYNPREVVLEPSFFCEMLGLQGRMDFLQMDHEVLIEQKSGKCGWPQHDPDTPVLKEPHFVQTLLYMTLLRYNYRHQYQRNNAEGRGLQAFVMYSRYRNSLLGVGTAPELVHEALTLRNALVAQELHCAEGGFALLATLTADDLNLLHVHGTLWERYTRPQIEELLLPLHTCSDTERAYYLRMMTFVSREHLLAKTGNRKKVCSGFSALWNESADAKRQAGNLYDNLTLAQPDASHEGMVEQVVFRFTEDEAYDMANFRVGDIVIAYPYNATAEPDARKTPVFRGTIERIEVGSIALRLRAPQGDAMPLRRSAELPWAIEHDFMESSFGGLYRGLHAFLSAPQERRDLLLLQRPPRVDISKTLRGDYGTFNELALRVRQAEELFLIIGPPGTGKTSYGLVNTLLEELHTPESNVLLMAYTNRAVDEICDKLIEQGLDFLRIGSELSCGKASAPHLLERRVAECANIDEAERLIAETHIVVGTTTSLSSHLALLELKQFALAIIDEASQILEPQIIGLLSAQMGWRPAIGKIVMIGDHKQLPAVVQQTNEESAVSDAALNKIDLTDCRLSLFERLLRRYRNHPEVVYTLTRQGRMHRDVGDFPSRAFYGGQLDIVPLPHQTEATLPDSKPLAHIANGCRLAFVHVSRPEKTPSDQVNLPEAEVIARLAEQIYRSHADSFDPDRTLGIIVPYRNQIATVRNLLAKSGIAALGDITIDTVERFQGSQRDYIIYGTTVQKTYQLDFLTEASFEEEGQLIDRKLNVALTRARKHQIVVGDSQLLSTHTVYRQLIEYTKDRKCYFDLRSK